MGCSTFSIFRTGEPSPLANVMRADKPARLSRNAGKAPILPVASQYGCGIFLHPTGASADGFLGIRHISQGPPPNPDHSGEDRTHDWIRPGSRMRHVGRLDFRGPMVCFPSLPPDGSHSLAAAHRTAGGKRRAKIAQLPPRRSTSQFNPAPGDPPGRRFQIRALYGG